MSAPRLASAPDASAAAVVVRGLTHRYGDRVALAGVDLEIERGEIFGVLGPNGGGKTTLFRVLATLTPPQEGTVELLGHDAVRFPDVVREKLGVVFQHPSLDGKLTVVENLRCHAALYGLDGAAVRERAPAMLQRLGLTERAGDRVDTLSGGLARRVELAMGLLHGPEMILLDEPSTGLDPGARGDFIRYLTHLRDTEGVTVVLTTHMMEEAERCDRVAFVHRGTLVAVGTPDALKAAIGGDVVVVDAHRPEGLQALIQERFGCTAHVVGGVLRLEVPRGHELVRDLVEAFPDEVRSITFGKPTLEDVFVHLTGHRFWGDDAPGATS